MCKENLHTHKGDFGVACMADFSPETDREKLLELAATAVEQLFAEMQGHAPSELYEDGYSDAIASAASVIRAMKLFHA